MLRQGLTPVPCTEEEISGCSAAVSHALTHFTENPEAVVAMACLQAFFEGDIQGAHSSIQKARSGHKIPTVRGKPAHVLLVRTCHARPALLFPRMPGQPVACCDTL